MNNLVSIIEIPVEDFSRAVNFYQTVMGIPIEEMEMDGNLMGVFPSEGQTVNVCLVKGDDYVPTTTGAVLYLYAGDALDLMLERITSSGGQVIVGKTEIDPEMGCYAMFIDSEGNKLGLHGIS